MLFAWDYTIKNFSLQIVNQVEDEIVFARVPASTVESALQNKTILTANRHGVSCSLDQLHVCGGTVSVRVQEATFEFESQASCCLTHVGMAWSKTTIHILLTRQVFVAAAGSRPAPHLPFWNDRKVGDRR